MFLSRQCGTHIYHFVLIWRKKCDNLVHWLTCNNQKWGQTWEKFLKKSFNNIFFASKRIEIKFLTFTQLSKIQFSSSKINFHNDQIFVPHNNRAFLNHKDSIKGSSLTLGPSMDLFRTQLSLYNRLQVRGFQPFYLLYHTHKNANNTIKTVITIIL